jgi:Dolichyl-phosphate-mannose-protein mannosyltransferase
VRRLATIILGSPLRTRVALFGLAGILAAALGFVLVKPLPAGHLIITWGYYYILAVFAAFVAFAVRVARSRRDAWVGWLRRPGWAGAAVAGGLAFAAWAEPFQHKILFDEFVIQGTAYELHAVKQVSTILRAYEINGTWVPIDPYLDKRPYFFPFLVSLVHDATGYRIANMFIVNFLFAGAFLALLYWLARQVAGRAPALLAVAAFASMPLFAQNATGSGMDLSNLTMLALAAALGILYLRVPSEERLCLLVYGALLLTESRYESGIFLFPVAFVVAAGWVRAGRVILPWPVVVAPLLLVPCAWHLKVISAEPVFWQLKDGQTSAFGWSNIASNLQGDLHYLFNTGPALANSWYVTVAGLAACAVLAVLEVRRRRAAGAAPVSAESLVLLAFGAGVLAHLAVLLVYWWARFDDLLASRFSLPLCTALVLALAVAVARLRQAGRPALRVALAGLAVWFLASGLPAMAYRAYTDENLIMQEILWEKAFVRTRPGPVLLFSNRSTIPFVLWKIPAIISAVGAERGEQIRYHLSQGTFREVLVLQSLKPSSAKGEYGVEPGDLMPASYHLETLAEKRFGTSIARISRIVSIDPLPAGAAKAAQGVPRATPLRLINAAQSDSEPAVAPATSSAESR